MSATVKVRVLRPLLYRAERREAGEVLSVPPADAWLLCSGGRAELRDQRDGEAVRKAVAAETKAALAREQRRPEPLPGPWRPQR